jgi:hypothetical protein
LPQPFAETASESTAARADELGLSPFGLRQLTQLEAKLDRRRGQF